MVVAVKVIAVPAQTAALLLEAMVAVGKGLTVTPIELEVPTGSVLFDPAAIIA